MFNSVVLEVVIGLILIFLLYSLLATVISEIVSTLLGLRAKNLREAICWMLEKPGSTKRLNRLFASIRSVVRGPKKKDCVLTEELYDLPEMKMLSNSGIFRSPSSIRKDTFSSAILSLLKVDKGNFPVFHADSKKFLEKIELDNSGAKAVAGKGTDHQVANKGTISILERMAIESGGEIEKFKSMVEDWFDKTMDQASEWYRRKMQVILLIIGFFIAWFFCTDTLHIVKVLSKDKNAREQMVTLAVAINSEGRYKKPAAAADCTFIASRLDSLLAVKKMLDADIRQTTSILGTGGWLPDSIIVSFDKISGSCSYSFPVDIRCLEKSERLCGKDRILKFGFFDKLLYSINLLRYHLAGFLLTALALSLGAPFWFDSLNRVMSLRTAFKPKEAGSDNK